MAKINLKDPRGDYHNETPKAKRAKPREAKPSVKLMLRTLGKLQKANTRLDEVAMCADTGARVAQARMSLTIEHATKLLETSGTFDRVSTCAEHPYAAYELAMWAYMKLFRESNGPWVLDSTNLLDACYLLVIAYNRHK